MSLKYFTYLCWTWSALGLVVFFVLLKIKAPFGRHTSTTWGPMINNKLGWFLMELPSLLIMLLFALSISSLFQSWLWILFLLWFYHYYHRSIIYPLRIKSTSKKMPLVIMFSAIAFNVINASLNGYYLKTFATPNDFQEPWLESLHFKCGLTLFLLGLLLNRASDYQLISLRKPGTESYQIPQGIFFKYISSPNLLGEILEWLGFAILAWNPAALSFCIWTIANLLPRALSHHQWYLNHFPNYPKTRKALIPFIL